MLWALGLFLMPGMGTAPLVAGSWQAWWGQEQSRARAPRSAVAGEGAEDAIVQERSCRRTKKILGQPSVLTAVEGSGLQGLNPDR